MRRAATPVPAALAALAAAAALAALTVLGGAARPAAASSRASATATPTAGELVAAYNGRSFGSPGWRRIRLDLVTDEKLTRRFEVIHGWQQQADAVRSLVLLEEPANLRGTNYLLVEGDGLESGLEVFLNLPAGSRAVLAIRPGRFDEGLLGSDFSYADLSWRIPTRGRELRLLGETMVAGQPGWVVESQPVTEEARRGTIWSRVRYTLGKDPVLLLAAAYYDDRPGGDGGPAKRLQVEGWRRVDGAWTPSQMEMTVTAGRRSVLTLLEGHFGSARFAPGQFRPEELPALAETLQAGRLPLFAQTSR